MPTRQKLRDRLWQRHDASKCPEEQNVIAQLWALLGPPLTDEHVADLGYEFVSGRLESLQIVLEGLKAGALATAAAAAPPPPPPPQPQPAVNRPIMSISNSALRRIWDDHKKWHEVETPTYVHPRLPGWVREFDKYWATHGEEFRTHAQTCQTAKCRYEPDRQGSYKYAGEMMQAFHRKFLQLAKPGERSVERRLGTFVCDLASLEAGDYTRPDVGYCIHPYGVQIDPGNLYAQLYQDHEMKKEQRKKRVASSTDVLDATVQIVSKGYYARRAKETWLQPGEDFIFSGAVSTGKALRSAIVIWRPADHCPEVVCGPWLTLAGSQVQGQNNVYFLDHQSNAVMELTFHTWLANRQFLNQQQVRAAAGPQDLPFQPDDELLIQSSSANGGWKHTTGAADVSIVTTTYVNQQHPHQQQPQQQQSIRVRITSVSDGILSGVALSGTSGNNVPVLVKVGSDPREQAVVNHVGLPWEAYYQVEREIAVRSQLRLPVRNLAPLYGAGVIAGVNHMHRCSKSCNTSSSSNIVDSNDSSSTAIGRSVLLMVQTGKPLAKTRTALPRLPLNEALVKFGCLLAAVVDLHLQGTQHGDMKPSNVAMNEGAPPPQRYYTYDMGMAVSPAVEQLADIVHPKCSAPLDCCPVADLEFSGVLSLYGRAASLLDSVQSVLFTTIRVTGEELPWTRAAAAGAYDEVMALRLEVAKNPSRLAGIGSWPREARQLAMASMAICSDKELLPMVQHYLTNYAFDYQQQQQQQL